MVRSSKPQHPGDESDRRRLIATIRFLALLHGLSQAEIARRAKTGQSAVSTIFSGNVDARLSTIQRLIRAVHGVYTLVLEFGSGTICIEAPEVGPLWVWSPGLVGTSWQNATLGPEHIRPARVLDATAAEAGDWLSAPRITVDNPYLRGGVRPVRIAHPMDIPGSTELSRTLEIINFLRTTPVVV